jgi:hypothetical protein
MSRALNHSSRIWRRASAFAAVLAAVCLCVPRAWPAEETAPAEPLSAAPASEPADTLVGSEELGSAEATNAIVVTNRIDSPDATNAPAATNSTRAAGSSSRSATGSGRNRDSRRDGRRGGNATSPPSPAGPGMDAFKILAQRNIFDPNRRPNSGRAPRPPVESRPPRVETISLLGTLISDKGAFAFFDGTDTKYQKVLSASGEIAGYKVSRITQRSTRLTSKDAAIEMKVGMQLRLQEDGKWRLVAEAGPATGGSGTSASSSSSTEGLDADSAASDVLKKLMQQREKELQ